MAFLYQVSYTSENVAEGKRAAKEALQQKLGQERTDRSNTPNFYSQFLEDRIQSLDNNLAPVKDLINAAVDNKISCFTIELV